MEESAKEEEEGKETGFDKFDVIAQGVQGTIDLVVAGHLSNGHIKIAPDEWKDPEGHSFDGPE